MSRSDPSHTTFPPEADDNLLDAFDSAYEWLKEEREQELAKSQAMIDANQMAQPDFRDPDDLEELWRSTDIYLDTVRDALERAETREEQKGVLKTIFDEIGDAIVMGGEDAQLFGEMRYFLKRTDEQLAHSYCNQQHPWKTYLEQLDEYGALLESAQRDINAQVERKHINTPEAQGVAVPSPYAYARKQYLLEHRLPDDADLDGDARSTIKHYAEEMVADVLSPYDDALPFDYTWPMAWFVARTNEMHSTHAPAHKQIVAAGPRRYGLCIEVPDLQPANDGGRDLPAQTLSQHPALVLEGEGGEHANTNTPEIKDKVIDTLSNIFLENLDAVDSIDHLLSAKHMLERRMTARQWEQSAQAIEGR